MNLDSEAPQTFTGRPVALNVGLDPDFVGAADESRAAFPTVDADTVRRGIEATRRTLDEMGLDFDNFLIDRTESVEARFRDKLASNDYAIIVIGGGVRLEPSLTHLFEALVNCIRTHSAHSTMCFNTGPDTTPEAIRRWWPHPRPIPDL
jgi:hypothetical protein